MQINLNQNKSTMYREITLVIVSTFLSASLAEAENTRDQITQLVSQIKRADYEGNRDELKRCYDQLEPFVNDGSLASRVRYWRGFAQWRRAINGFNDKVDPQELEQELNAALDEFKIALEKDLKFVDAKVGTISCMGFLFFVHREDEVHRKERREHILALLREAEEMAPDNPRLIWVHGPIYWNTPVEKGGGQDKMIQVYEKALENWSKVKPSGDPLEPSWGKPELLMSLAYAYMNKKTPDANAAEPYARSALELVPYWHYTRDILLPQILAAKEKAKAN